VLSIEIVLDGKVVAPLARHRDSWRDRSDEA
jgi:hypothetical protein